MLKVMSLDFLLYADWQYLFNAYNPNLTSTSQLQNKIYWIFMLLGHPKPLLMKLTHSSKPFMKGFSSNESEECYLSLKYHLTSSSTVSRWIEQYSCWKTQANPVIFWYLDSESTFVQWLAIVISHFEGFNSLV